MNEFESRIRALVRKARGLLHDVKTGDLATMYARLGLPEAQSMSSAVAGNILYDRIHALMTWNDKATVVRLDALERHLALRHLADNAPFLDCLSLLFNLREATRQDQRRAPPLSQEGIWLLALGAAKDYRRVHGQAMAQVPYISPRVGNVARAVKTLRKEGLAVRIEGGEATIADAERRGFAGKLEARIAKLGGVEFANYLFERIARWYDPAQGRHHIVRRLSTTGTSDWVPATPVGYLLNLAVKNVTCPPTFDGWQEYAEETIKLAEAFVDILDLREFSTFGVMFKDHDSVLPFLREVVLYDGAYGLVQARPGDVARVLRGLFDWLPAGQPLGQTGWTVAQFAEVVEVIAALSKGIRGPAIVPEHQVVALIGSRVPPATVREILDACAHLPGTVNASYVLPSDHVQATYWTMPLIKDQHGYLLLDPAWCFPAFYEVLVEAVEALAQHQVSRRLGPALERVVQAELTSHGMTFSSGKYRVGGIEGECDLVVETKSTIIFIEVKKRPLQRAAKGGDPVTLLADLSEALLFAQEQAARHELVLYRDGQLVLTNGTTVHTVHRNGRDAERVALTHLDYGSLQDRLVLFEVLRLLSGASLTTTDPDPKARAHLARLEEHGKRLLERHQELDKLRPPHPHNPFHHCWFLSLGHLLVMLDHVASNEEFWNELRQTRSMTMGSLDFYFEYAQARRLRAPTGTSDSVIIASTSP